MRSIKFFLIFIISGFLSCSLLNYFPNYTRITKELRREISTEHFVFHFSENDTVYTERQETYFKWLTAKLGIEPRKKIHYYKYRDRAQIFRLLKYRGNGTVRFGRVHTVWPWDNHETVHVLVGEYIGSPPKLFNEGIAVAFQVDPVTGRYIPKWGSRTIDEVSVDLITGSKAPPLDSLLVMESFLQYSPDITYPLAGSFAKYLFERYGIDTFCEFIRDCGWRSSLAGIKGRFSKIYKKRLSECWEEWMEWLPARHDNGQGSNISYPPDTASTPEHSHGKGESFAKAVIDGIKRGVIRYRLTEPEEVEELIGEPEKRKEAMDGGFDILEVYYPGIRMVFGKLRMDERAPFTILGLEIEGRKVDIGKGGKLVLRNNGDLRKLDRFLGLQNVSLKNLDLRGEAELLSTLSFDSYTEWPSRDSLPEDFDPGKLLEEGKNPGLGIRSLHSRGITGKGVGIAIIDQPLLVEHREYAGRIVKYEAKGLEGFAPQMHGPPVASIAVGYETGVAPDASLTYFAVPMWEKDDAYYIMALRRIFELNETLPVEEKIRVVSISDGLFEEKKRFEEWMEVLGEAERRGILVVTCDESFMKFGTLNLVDGEDPDSPYSYVPGRYCSEDDVLRVPAGNKTVASHRGVDAYTFDRIGGRSWAAPYIAGLAALAFQVNPNISPAEIKDKLVETVVVTRAGPVVDSVASVESVMKR